MLDEALDVLVGLWSGEPFSYTGAHYRVEEVTCLPRPVQLPRIPIWVGGAYPNRGPTRRAACWDGACLYKATRAGSAEDSGEPLSANEIADLKRTIDRERTASTPFDIMVHGWKPGNDEDATRARLRASVGADAIWCQEWIPPSDFDTMRSRIVRGPVRIH
jgi:alkanesulfonate monooxygenase SsuD/methylene tetrahydromethanopterin reductase-like flavin-dependent oxidoreductase (luciferase family)